MTWDHKLSECLELMAAHGALGTDAVVAEGEGVWHRAMTQLMNIELHAVTVNIHLLCQLLGYVGWCALAYCCASSGELLRLRWILEFHAMLSAHVLWDHCRCSVFLDFLCLWLNGLQCRDASCSLHHQTQTSLIFGIDSLTRFILTSRRLLTCSSAATIIIQLPCLGFCHHQSSS